MLQLRACAGDVPDDQLHVGVVGGGGRSQRRGFVLPPTGLLGTLDEEATDVDTSIPNVKCTVRILVGWSTENPRKHNWADSKNAKKNTSKPQ